MAVVQLPFVERLRLVPSAVISIEVEVRNKPYRFNFNLTSDEKSVATRSLHISIRFDKKVIIFNSIRDGKWDGEEPVKNFPFRRDSEFELSVRVTKSTYELSVDGKPVYTYKQRLPHNYSSVNFINLQDSTKGSAPGFILTSFKVVEDDATAARVQSTASLLACLFAQSTENDSRRTSYSHGVVQAIQKVGSTRWYSLGRKCGQTYDWLQGLKGDHKHDCDKVQALFDVMALREGEKQAADILLDACKAIPTPIFTGVKEEMEKSNLRK